MFVYNSSSALENLHAQLRISVPTTSMVLRLDAHIVKLIVESDVHVLDCLQRRVAITV